MDLEGLLAADESGWKELVELFAQIPTHRLDEPTVTPEGWSPKDVMFHIGAWLAEARASSTACARARTGSRKTPSRS